MDEWKLTQDAGEKRYLLNILKHLQFQTLKENPSVIIRTEELYLQT